jgi:hypothetical protein
MSIRCPQTNRSVAVTVGTDTDTICVQGTLESQAIDPPLTPEQMRALAATKTVLVQVALGPVTMAPASPPALGTTQAVVTGSDWCAQNVPVPTVGLSLPGDACTALAWQLNASSVVEAAMAQPFYTVDASIGGDDCCSGCSGSASGMILLAAGVGGVQSLFISIPDGENAGDYTADAAGTRAWKMTVGGIAFTIAAAENGLTIAGPGIKACSTSIAFDPFSATFDGAVFGACDDVVVIEA